MNDHRAIAAATLLSLPAMRRDHLERLLAHWPSPELALHAIETRAATIGARLGVGEPQRKEWADAVAGARERVSATIRRRGAHVFARGDLDYPIPVGETDSPAVLFAEGRGFECLPRARVAIVGTRSATPHGLADARALGRALVECGCTIVSGLAIGIDGAAHEGALEVCESVGDGAAALIGIVATGLDVTYPRRHGPLHERVRRHGLLLSEQPYGVGPARYRFPIRNRIIALVCDVLVVVEATENGGSLITAREALDLHRPVLAMPGSRRSAASRGCNALIHRSEAAPCLEVDDVLAALDLQHGRLNVERREPRRALVTAPPFVPAELATVLDAFGGEPATIDEIVVRVERPPDQVAAAFDALSRLGAIERVRGHWWPR